LYPLHRTADHDKKFPLGRAPDTAGHRGVDDLYVLLSQPFHPALDGGGSDGSHDHDDRARVQRRRCRILAEQDAVDLQAFRIVEPQKAELREVPVRELLRFDPACACRPSKQRGGLNVTGPAWNGEPETNGWAVRFHD